MELAWCVEGEVGSDQKKSLLKASAWLEERGSTSQVILDICLALPVSGAPDGLTMCGAYA